MKKEQNNNSIVGKYGNFLDGISNKLSDWEGIKKSIKNNKIKILVMVFVVQTLLTMYRIWDRGQCINCLPLTEEQKELYGNELNYLVKTYENKIFVPYESIQEYFKDLIFPLIFSTIILFILLSFWYIIYKIIQILIKKIFKWKR